MSRLIDADALTERLNEYANDDWNVSLGGVFTDAVDTCLDFVENAPTIEAVPVVHSEWKYYRNKCIAVCKNCSFERNLNENFGMAIACPNCGADMRNGGA